MSSTNKTTNLELNDWLPNDTSKREDFNADNEKIDAWAGEVNSQLNEIEQKVDNIDLSADKVSLAAISGMSAKSVQAGIAELFQYANNGKQYMVDAIGSPVVKTDTFATMKSRIQTLKNTMATNIKSKGVDAVGTETLNSLISKVNNITVATLGGKKFATGTINHGDDYKALTDIYGQAHNGYSYSITGLGFIPSVVIFYNVGKILGIYNNGHLYYYHSGSTTGTDGITYPIIRVYSINENPCMIINASSVVMYMKTLASNVTYVAYE